MVYLVLIPFTHCNQADRYFICGDSLRQPKVQLLAHVLPSVWHFELIVSNFHKVVCRKFSALR